MKRTLVLTLLLLCHTLLIAQVNTDRVLAIGRNALYFEDYVLSIQYFNQVIKAKPWMAEPYLYRAIAKINLDDYQGAEEDCSLCLARNEFIGMAYYARGIARQSQEKYEPAINDYERGLELRPNDRAMMTNLAIACVQHKDYHKAAAAFERLIAAYPKQSAGYMTRAAMYAEQGDTVRAMADYDKAIETDPYFAPCYGSRALLRYQTGRYTEALADLDEAIRLNTREKGFYINRGLVRYQLNNLRGAMADYDQVIDMDSLNLIARFNRGLLRFQVGDNNRAIEDFDVVIALEPDNFMAYYNRALLNSETGNYAGAIGDFDVVLQQYPNFLPGYYSRSEAKRKMNDAAGADRDYWTAIRLEEKKRNGQLQPTAAQTTPADSTANVAGNTREQSDKNIDKFNRLVVYDRKQETESKYESSIRGRVQDRSVRIDIEPAFILTFYEEENGLNASSRYDKSIEAFNARSPLAWRLLVTNHEAPLTEAQIATHFASINRYATAIEQDTADADLYFGRALDYMLVQDFAEAIRNLDRTIELNPAAALAYFNRAAIRNKQIEYARSDKSNTPTPDRHEAKPTLSIRFAPHSPAPTGSTTTPPDMALKELEQTHEHEAIMRDYETVIRLAPDFVYAYYNRGNIRCTQRDYRAAIADYTEAIRRNEQFAEAYFNRGLARLSQGDAARGIADLSKAGELGMPDAYGIIKRMTERND